MRKAVFLDRDGVLNQSIIIDRKPYGPKTVEEFVLSPDLQELHKLRDLGYLLIVATNQPDVARGLISRAFVDELHARLLNAFAFDDIMVCFHRSEDHCLCRKPEPGLLYQAQDKYGIHLAASYMVGDRWRDILAGQVAGCRTVWIDHGYQEDAPDFHPDFSCVSLSEAVRWIMLQHQR